MGASDNDTRNTVRSITDTVNQTARSVERTCTQKLTIPILEKHDNASVRLWWRRFTQYVKMTKEIDLTEMTTSKEIRHEYRDCLELEIKDVLLGTRAISDYGDD